MHLTRQTTSLLSLLLLCGAATVAHAADAPGDSARRYAARVAALTVHGDVDRADNPSGAEAFYWRKRSADGKPVSAERYLAAANAMRLMPQRSSVSGAAVAPRALGGGTGPSSLLSSTLGAWEPLGPGNIGGRTRALLIDPRNPTVMYAGGVAGGVWKSVDSGASWLPIGDLLPNIAVNSLAMSPADSDVLYAGTGEGYFNIDRVRGAGIFKTSDGGKTWARLASTATPDFYYVNDIVISHTNANRVYAATGTGVWRSTDGGQTWRRVLVKTPDTFGGCLDLAIRTDRRSDTVFASCNTFSQAEIWRNTRAETGTAWIRVLSQREMGRTALAIAPSNQDIVYALGSANKPGTPFDLGFYALFRSNAGGELGSWKARLRNSTPDKLSSLLLSNPVIAFLKECGYGSSNALFNQGWYDNVIAVDPVNPEVVWTGGIDLFRSDDGGKSFGVASYWWASDSTGAAPSYAHADQHAILFDPRYDGVHQKSMFVGNDGGLFRTDDARAATARGLDVCDPDKSAVQFTALNNGYAVTQFYHGLPYPDGKSYFGGTQDNGTPRGNDTDGADAWTEINAGDGGYVAIDPHDTDTLFSENTGNSLQKSVDGGATWNDATNGIADPGFLFIAPFTMNDADSQLLFTGGAWIWRTHDGAGAWERASDFVAGDNNSLVSAVASAPSRPGRALVGLSEGYIHRSDDALHTGPSTAWAFTQPREGYVSSVTFDPADADVAYATYSTFGGVHVWKTADGGLTWQPLDGSGAGTLPDLPAHSLAIDPEHRDHLFVGTDLGVFVSGNGGQTWEVEDSGFPNVVTEWLAVRADQNGREIYAFTHGRGAWRARLH